MIMIIVYLMLESNECTAGDGELTKGCNGHGIAVHLTECQYEFKKALNIKNCREKPCSPQHAEHLQVER